MHRMDDMSQRLRKARKLAGYKTMRAATEAHGLHYPTYAGHENGHRKFPHDAAYYADLFHVSLVWLMTGRGQMKVRGGQHPIVDLFEAIPLDKQGQAIEYLEFLGRNKT